jgi:uncharacterized protein (TIGR00299 family) protein
MISSGQDQIVYADCFSGVSGDMFLGALVNAGLPLDHLLAELTALDLGEFSVQPRKDTEQGISATRIAIESKVTSHARNWNDIKELIRKSSLPDAVKEKSLSVFSCLAEAEAKVHGCPVEKVHFHEIGGLDSIIDIVGAVIGLRYFGIARLVSSPLPMPRGWVDSGHGQLPIPAPAVCEILKDVPVYGSDIGRELVTPTGAALIKSLASEFGNIPAMRIKMVGYGAGSQKLPDNRPNLFRLLFGVEEKTQECQEVEVIETNLDDWSPEPFPHLCDQLFMAGALDVSLLPIHMKKGRPGFLLRVITDPARSWQIKQCIFAETTTIGLRYRREKRMTLPREVGTVNTCWGPVAVKRIATDSGYVLYPEYEACRRVALAKNVPLKDIYAAINRCSPDDYNPEKGKD